MNGMPAAVRIPGLGPLRHHPRRLAIGIRLGQPGLPHGFDPHSPVYGHLHEPGDEGPKQRVAFLVGGHAGLDELRHAIGVAALHTVQHQTVQVKESGFP
jgi:hypothetical protein